MSPQRAAVVEAYLDGTLDAAGAQHLATVLAAGGDEAAEIRAQVALPGMLAVALDELDMQAVARGVAERLHAQADAVSFRRVLRRRLATTPRRTRTGNRQFTLASLLTVAVMAGLGWWWMAALWSPSSSAVVPTAIIHWQVAEVGEGASMHSDATLQPLRIGTVIKVGSQLNFPGGGSVTASDLTRLTLAAGSQLALLADGWSLTEGSLTAAVTHQPAGQLMQIRTPEALIEVVGTHFILERTVHGTHLDLQQGVVRLTRQVDHRSELVTAGQRVDVAVDVAVDATVDATGAQTLWVPLFPQRGLAGWQARGGTWSNDDGTVIGQASAQAKNRLASLVEYGDLELQCRLRVSGGLAHCEIQVGDYNWFVTVGNDRDHDHDIVAWHSLHLQQVMGHITATLDGHELPIEAGAGAAPRVGPLAFYTPVGVRVEITDAQLRLANRP